MPAISKRTIRHFFGGGWATDFGPSADVSPDASGKVVIPFLVDAENCLFELDGAPHKIGGTTRVNSVALESGAAVVGLHDYWRQGTGGSPTRRRVVHVGTKVMADTDDTNFATTLASGLESGKVPSYCTFDDLLIYSSDSTIDVPRSWDQTTSQNLAGSPPRFSFCVSHKNRAWAAGVHSQPSRLYYSANTDPEDWTGPGSGSIDIDPQDGDMITGLVSHKDELIVFKGPNKGSIHRITGSSPTGSDAFSRKSFVVGLGAAWHNATFRFADEIGFVSQYGSVHSLSATAAYGDFIEAALSRPINKEIGNTINYSRLRFIWAATDPLTGVVYITASWQANATNNAVLAMDFRNAPEVIRWSRIPAYAFAAISTFVDTNGVRRVLGGSYSGFVRRLNIVDRSLDTSTAYNYKVTTPHLNYGFPIAMKTMEQGSIGIFPRGSFDFTFGWTRDDHAQQTLTLAQGGADVLGPASDNQFTLDTSALAGAKYVDVYHEFNEQGGEFRSVQYQVQQSGLNEDMEVHSISASVTIGAESTENG
jgi:hypothetical protein